LTRSSPDTRIIIIEIIIEIPPLRNEFVDRRVLQHHRDPCGCAGCVDYLVTAFPKLYRMLRATTADLDSSLESNGYV